MMRARLVPLLVATAMLTAVSTASGDPRSSACFDAAVEGQKLRNASKLAAARAALVTCAATSCPTEVARECARWFTEVSAAMPSVVFAAKDASGSDLVDVVVEVDGVAAGSTGDGRPFELDPGPHDVAFRNLNGKTVTARFVARAGEKNRAVMGDFTVRREPRIAQGPTSSPSRPIPTASLALGAAGGFALGIFGYFGASGLSERGRLGCGTGCARSDKDDVDTKFLIADVALGVGVLAMAAAVVVYLTRPAAQAEQASASAGGAIAF